MKYLQYLFLLLGLVAAESHAQNFDARVKLDQIAAGSYIILKGYYADAPDKVRYVSHVYAGRSGDLYRLQLYRGRFPEGELARTQFLDQDGHVVKDLQPRGLYNYRLGPIARYLGPLYHQDSDPPNYPEYRVEGDQVIVLDRRDWFETTVYAPNQCRREMGECTYFSENRLTTIRTDRRPLRVECYGQMQDCVTNQGEYLVINTATDDGYSWAEYLITFLGTRREMKHGTVELDEMGSLQRKTYLGRDDREYVLEQIEAVYR